MMGVETNPAGQAVKQRHCHRVSDRYRWETSRALGILDLIAAVISKRLPLTGLVETHNKFSARLSSAKTTVSLKQPSMR